MDLVSHALLPYLLGNLLKRKKEEIAALTIGGIAPDFDIFLLWINFIYPNFFLLTHRGITHSLFFGFFTCVFILYLATQSRVKNIVKRYIDFEPVFSRRTILFAFAGVIIHLILDYSTTRGVPLLYPFDVSRYSAEVFFYTDTYLMILALVMVIWLYRKPLQKNTAVKFLVIYLIVFAGLGTARLTEKISAEQFFHDTGIKAYPTMSIFDWYALGIDNNEIKIYEYNGFNRTSVYNETVPALDVLSQGAGLDSALGAAGELPQIKMFEWRAYAVAVNATSSDGVWLLEYYDPLGKAMARGAPAFLMRINKPIRVKVEAGKAVVV
ncbi:MAG: metal-dependent hydrolase [Candidatus Methanoperedens sp.]|nr:metal-dependent hydrolase [Candidatus Methanoperedens sp.]